MIIPDSKRATTVILSRLGEKNRAPVEVKDETEIRPEDEAFRVIAEDIMQAFENKSTSELANSLRNFLDQHELGRMPRE
jgi:hypothetical protein